jgi:DNA-binding transcriptional ArsR family regulator
MTEDQQATAVVAHLKEGARRVEEATSRGIGHRIRIEILAALHEGPANATQLARIVRQSFSKTFNHLKELLADGSIEIARTEKVGNHEVAYYCVVELPFFSDEDIAAMTPEQRQITAALILQAAESEALSALWAGKMHNDEQVFLAWDRLLLDEQAREDLAEEQLRSWTQMKEISVEAANRMAVSGEPGKMYVITSYGYERHRSKPPDTAGSEVPPTRPPTDS